MDLQVVTKQGKRQLDLSVAEQNLQKYTDRETVLLEMLEDARFELGNAKRILEIMNGLNMSHSSYVRSNNGEEYFFFNKYGDRTFALEFEFHKVGLSHYLVLPLDLIQMIPCPGCPKMQPLIGHEGNGVYEELVICGNSVYILKREEQKSE